ncbi:OmpH family outer membrane protein [Basilea psittacipulmonis]|uniref:Molecular chaperone Skp n=1 Tax=Basilea psittacipulmonis DSM 24701 TaxID=1072685 RepID=A0A077DHL5_9BURK|nr:OmpH family outer membrane protein [Basilea psittacipulmonis]AIL32638.1 hypothetical protein IX83_04345 [Basilea psittacipulmonis DSM 24701]
MKKLIISSVIAGLCAVSVAATPATNEAPLKIGFVNTNKILHDSAPAKEAQSKLEAEFKKREDDWQKKFNDLQAKYEQYKKNSSIMNDTQLKKAENEIKDLETYLSRQKREIQEDFDRRRNEIIASIVEKANQAIDDIAKKENYDLILQDAVTVSDRIDITDEVLKLLGTKNN